VSFDTVAQNQAFAKKFNYPFPLLCDTGRDIGMAYGACDSPDAATARRITYVIGPEGRIVEAYPKVAPADHPAEVLRVIEGRAASA
jgi:peroxiredoxin Q/BCP